MIDTSAQNSGLKTKESLIHQAHEARQARELSRRKDEAASRIQAFLRSVQTRRQLKTSACKQVESLFNDNQIPDEKHALLDSLRQLLFFCNLKNDSSIIKTSLNFIARQLAPIGELEVKESNENNPKPKTLLDTILNESCENEKARSLWTNLLTKFANICLTCLDGANFNQVNPHLINNYLQVLAYLTDKNLCIDSASSKNLEHLSTANYMTEHIYSSSLKLRRVKFFESFTLLLSGLSRLNDKLKSDILANFTAISLRLMSIHDLTNPDLSNANKICEPIDSMIKTLSLPSIVHLINTHSQGSLRLLNSHKLFETLMKLILNSDQHHLKDLTLTPSLCLLANFIQLAYFNQDIVAVNLIDFVKVVTQILEACKNNMPTQQSDGVKKRPTIGMSDVSYNPLLGWLTREKEVALDKPGFEAVRLQLSLLWCPKFLKLIFQDLIQTNEKIALMNHTDELKNSNRNKSMKNKNTSAASGNLSPYYQETGSFSSIAPIIFIKKLIASRGSQPTIPISKSSSPSHSMKVGSSGTASKCELLSPDAYRISTVCNMYSKALTTLSGLKQDILASLCMNDYLLINLWSYIRSLGPQNGLKAHLGLLVIMSKTEAPEFQLLTLFCECASHIINVLDDSELYDKQKPFSCDDLVAISAFLNQFVFHGLCYNLFILDNKEPDAVLKSVHKLLIDFYKRDSRRRFASQDHWLLKDVKLSAFLKDFDAGRPSAKTILSMMPHIIPHKERVRIFRKLVARDKSPNHSRPSTLITINRSRIVEDGYQQLARLSPNALKGLIRVKFINDYGLDEAGIDQDGVFKEFLEDTIQRVFDPSLNLFRSTSEQRLYPSPTSRLHEEHLSLFNFVGKMLGKAVYEGIVVDVPFATFFLSRVLGQPQSPLYSPIDELPSLDPELYKSLTYIKHYDGDVSELNLTFSIDQDFMGKIETYELQPGGRSIPVTNESRVRYIHSIANFHMKTQIEKQTEAFIQGFRTIINLEWLAMFSASELQRLISGDTTPIDLQDLRRNTKYFGGFHNNHRVISWLWDILEKDFTPEEHKLFLKFITSCSKPPLLGFSNLEPPFSIRYVEVSDDQDLGDSIGSILRGFLALRRSDPVDRLPTSSTCFNMLKLPNYMRRSTLREKLRYAIHSSPGFELS